jgi:hypothetical protein
LVKPAAANKRRLLELRSVPTLQGDGERALEVSLADSAARHGKLFVRGTRALQQAADRKASPAGTGESAAAATGVSDACAAAGSDAVDGAAVSGVAAQLFGDERLLLQGVRYAGACRSLGLAALKPPNALSAVLGSAVVISTGAAADAAADANSLARASTAFGTPAGPADGFPSGSFDAAVLEIDVLVSPAAPAGSQLSLMYIFGSEEYRGGGRGSRRPDPLVFHIRPAGSTSATSLALLPGGGAITGAAARPAAPIEFYDNAVVGDSPSPIAAALDGFTQVS